MSKLDTKPYILRALYDWALDSGYTPHIVAWVNENTQVPLQYVRDNEIVLNIGATAAHNLTIDDKWVHFAARFNGISHDIWIPVGHVSSIFARETGEGMGFDVEPLIFRIISLIIHVVIPKKSPVGLPVPILWLPTKSP